MHAGQLVTMRIKPTLGSRYRVSTHANRIGALEVIYIIPPAETKDGKILVYSRKSRFLIQRNTIIFLVINYSILASYSLFKQQQQSWSTMTPSRRRYDYFSQGVNLRLSLMS